MIKFGKMTYFLSHWSWNFVGVQDSVVRTVISDTRTQRPVVRTFISDEGHPQI